MGEAARASALGIAVLLFAVAVDVACAPPAVQADAGPEDPPQILSIDPPDGSVDVAVDPVIRFVTDEHLDDFTVEGASFYLYTGSVDPWLMAYYDPVMRRASVWSSSKLRANADWILEANENAVFDLEGEPLAAGAMTRFTTGELEGDDVPFPELRYEPDIAPIFDSRCASCHGGTSPMAGLGLDSPSAVIGTAIGVASRGRPDYDRIAPARPGRSYLVYKLLGDGVASGLRMPCELDGETPSEALAFSELRAISDWIAGGAVMGP